MKGRTLGRLGAFRNSPGAGDEGTSHLVDHEIGYCPKGMLSLFGGSCNSGSMPEHI